MDPPATVNTGLEELPTDSPRLLPVRMLNEFAYCPRLFHLMHVEGRWADNVYTVEGKAVHRRVDKLDHVLPEAEATATESEAKPTGKSRRPKPQQADETGNDGDEPPVASHSTRTWSRPRVPTSVPCCAETHRPQIESY